MTSLRQVYAFLQLRLDMDNMKKDVDMLKASTFKARDRGVMNDTAQNVCRVLDGFMTFSKKLDNLEKSCSSSSSSLERGVSAGKSDSEVYLAEVPFSKGQDDRVCRFFASREKRTALNVHCDVVLRAGSNVRYIYLRDISRLRNVLFRYFGANTLNPLRKKATVQNCLNIAAKSVVSSQQAERWSVLLLLTILQTVSTCPSSE
jgi:hypothetical protein